MMYKNIQNEWYEDKWFELSCYYHYQTEMYDRSLTDMRSPHDPTEAYLCNSNIRSLSNANTFRSRKLIDNIAQTERIQRNENRHNELSAQGWIDQYIELKNSGRLDWLNKYT